MSGDPDLSLPGRSRADEDAFVEALHEAPGPAIEAAVRAAVRGRRPRLAARLVGLLGEGVDPGDAELARALKAAEFLCLEGRDARVEADLEELLALLRRRRRERFKFRHAPRRGKRKRPRWWSRYRD